MSGYRRLFIMRKDLNMSAGKLAAQVGHCAEAYFTNIIRKGQILNENTHHDDGMVDFQISLNADIISQYINGIFTKTICEAKNKNQLLKAKEKALELGLVEGESFGLIYDACLTELEPEEEDGRTITGIWFAPLPDEIAHEISRKYQLYK